MRPNHFCRVRVESELQALRVRDESKLFKIFRGESWLGRVESESSHNNCRDTSSRWFARVNVESNEISHFSYDFFGM